MDRTIRLSATRLFLALVVATLTPASSWAQAGAGEAQGGGPSSEQVLRQMRMANLMMIRLGELAEEKGVSSVIRRQGDREARDHRFGDRRVAQVAAQMGIQLPSELPSPGQGGGMAPGQQGAGSGQGEGGGMQEGGPPPQLQRMMQMAQQLEQAPPEQFDAGYRQAMAQMHGQVVGQLEQARSALGEYSPVGSLIGKVGPILGQHHDLAVALEDDVGAAAGRPAGQ